MKQVIFCCYKLALALAVNQGVEDLQLVSSIHAHMTPLVSSSRCSLPLCGGGCFFLLVTDQQASPTGTWPTPHLNTWHFSDGFRSCFRFLCCVCLLQVLPGGSNQHQRLQYVQSGAPE